MKHRAFYITTYNDPGSAGRLMEQLSGLAGLDWNDLYLSDQSDDEAAAEAYRGLCEKHGYVHLRWPNEGATRAKLRVVEHAVGRGYEYLSQVSEDFELTTEETRHAAFVSGAAVFLKDCQTLLNQVQHVPFVHWTCVRGVDAFGYLTTGVERMGNRIHRLPGMTLAYMTGDVSLWNWPYTGRTQAVANIWRQGQALVPGCDLHKRWAGQGGGEWKQQWVSHGHGACLLAQPVRHGERVKPEGSLP